MFGGEVEETLGHSPHAVLGGQRNPVAVGLGQPAHKRPHQHERGVRMLAEKGAELIGVHETRLDVIDRDRRGGPALSAERRHLAEQLTRSPDRQHHLTLIGAVGDEANPAGEDEHDVVAGGSGAEDHLRARNVAAACLMHERIRILLPELPQKGHVGGAHSSILPISADVRNVARRRASPDLVFRTEMRTGGNNISLGLGGTKLGATDRVLGLGSISETARTVDGHTTVG
jgi:hypothetical protein